MSGNSNVGNAALYEAGDQRNAKGSQVETAKRFEEGKANSHMLNDSKDQRSIANRLAAAERSSEPEDKEKSLNQQDPTRPATMHGNKPSKGAQIDAEIQAEEEDMLQKKGGQNMPGKK